MVALNSKLRSRFPLYWSSLPEQPQPQFFFYLKFRNLVFPLKVCFIKKKTMHLYMQSPNLGQFQLIFRLLASL